MRLKYAIFLDNVADRRPRPLACQLSYPLKEAQEEANIMASRASIGGHPIHPMLIPFPIGLLVFSFIADLIYLWRGNLVWRDYIAFYTLLGGIIGAAAAAIPGLIDWATLTDRAAVKAANWHARVNITTLVIL